ncbi:MAG: PQQ-binding-like beta-propeller repeat protein [Gemmataceae bacterium]
MRLKNGLASLLLIAGISLVVGSPGLAANWPRFRGPNGDGIAADKDIPVKWDEKSGLLWKIGIPGQGNSSPIVWGKRLFVQSANPDSGERSLICVDTTNGKILWTRSAKGAKAAIHPKNSFASSTPATDGKLVYALFWDGREIEMRAYDLEGNEVWQHDLGPFTSGGKTSHSQHGAGASPIVVDDRVILNNDNDKFAALVALDAKTGKPGWKADRPSFRTCYSTPFVLERPGAPKELIVASTAGITSYNPKDGEANWNYSWSFDGMPLRTVASPIYSHGLIFINGGDGSGDRHLIAVKAEGKGDVTKTNLVWENKKAFPYVPTLLALGDHLFYVTDNGFAGCCVATTGEMVWQKRLGGAFSSSPIIIDGKIYAVTEAGEVYVYEAKPTFKLLAKNSLGEAASATPAVADNRLFIRGQDHLFCIGKAEGK